MFVMRVVMRYSWFVALLFLGNIVGFDLNRHVIACSCQQDSEVIAQIESGLANCINRVKKFRKVTFENLSKSGSVKIEVSSENDNFAVVIRPTSTEGHYTTNVYGGNEDYGFWLGKQAEDSDAMVIRSITDYQSKASQYDANYAYGNLLKTLADSGMISCSIFCPFTYLRFSDPNCGVESVSRLADSSDLYVVSFRPKLDDIADKFGNVHNLGTIKSGKITFSKSFGFLPVSGELQRSVTLSNNRTESWSEKLEWTYEPVEDYFRLASFVCFRPDMPIESKIERKNFRWESQLTTDEFRITRFGLEEPRFVESKWSVPFWFWLVVIGILVVLLSWVLTRSRASIHDSI